MPLVFQYGSNMSTIRLNGPKRLNGNAIYVGVAETVETYEFTFDVWSDGNGNAAADIIPGPGRRIWGVLYEVAELYIFHDPARKRRTLDGIESEGRNYYRTHVNLRYPDGGHVPGPVITYLGLQRKDDIKTSAEYVGFILAGLTEHPAIPAEYAQYIRARALANNQNLQLP